MAEDLFSLMRRAKAQAGGAGAALGASLAGAPGGGLADAQGIASAAQGLAAPAGPGSGPRASHVQADLAADANQAQARDLSQQVGSQESRIQEAARHTETAAAQQARSDQLDSLALAEGHAQEEARLVERARQAKAAGDQAAVEAALDQAAFNRRLSNEKYVQTLQQEGALQRLDDSVSFKEALQNDVFAEEASTLKDYLGWKEWMSQDENQFREQLATIDINAAIAISGTQAEAANTAATAGAASGILAGGISAWGAQQNGSFDSDYQKAQEERESQGLSRQSYGGWQKQQGTAGGAAKGS